MKHLILIHGRATKPREAEKTALSRRALLNGMRRIDPAAAEAIENGEVAFSFVYYGDINNELMLRADPSLRQWLEETPEGWFEKTGSYDDDLDRLLARDLFTRDEYRKLVAAEKDRRFFDDLASLISPFLAGGLSLRIIKRVLPDLAAYITSRKVGSAIRERLQAPLTAALRRGDDVALVAHSMGCIASYDVLWKLSHMSEYREFHGRPISLWLTLGSPLGEPAVRQALYDAHEPADGRYPRNISQWVNIAAHDDFVAHDEAVEDDFRAMKQFGEIEDTERIHTFWVGAEGMNPHKFYGYLDHPVVAGQVAAWVNAPVRAAR